MTRPDPPLPPIVGYAALEATYGWNKRTLQRWVRAGKLPRPMTMPGGRVAWHLADMEAFIDNLRPGLAVAAVTDPAKLAPERLVPTIMELGARLASEQLGEIISPDSIAVRVELDPTHDEIIDCRAKFLERLEELCGHFSYDRALHIACSIFPAIKERLSEDGKFGSFRDADHLREFCISILDDEQWAELEKAVAASMAKAT